VNVCASCGGSYPRDDPHTCPDPREHENKICEAPDVPHTLHSPGLTMIQCERYVRKTEQAGGTGQWLAAVTADHRVQLGNALMKTPCACPEPPPEGALHTAQCPQFKSQYQRQFPVAGPNTALEEKIRLNPAYEKLLQDVSAELEPVESVNHPAHYGGDTVYEVIKVLEAWGLDSDAYLFNVVKYIARPGKGNYLEDLKKARFYLDRKIARMEEGGS
jgi:hypothetical protein